jgi:ribosome-binding protein aMBF1 (putative translation factor)
MTYRPAARPGRTLDAVTFERERREPEFGAERDRIAHAMAIANAVTVARSRRQLSQDKLAIEMRTTRSAISRLESGRHLPGLDTLQRLSDALDLVFEIAPGGPADELEDDLIVVRLSRPLEIAGANDE